jgi:uncharacterized protein YggU (UPF0235/DUF167 family)
MYIHVKVKASMKKESFKELKKDHFEASVKEPAERNMANRRVIELVAQHFNLLPNKVRITNGHQSPSKLLVVELE